MFEEKPRKYVLRSQLQVDASPQLKQALKQIALEENVSLKQLVLDALRYKYPQLTVYVNADLHQDHRQ